MNHKFSRANHSADSTQSTSPCRSNVSCNATVSQLTQYLQVQRKNRLSDKHYQDLTVTRGLDAAWVEANCASIDKREASDKLGYEAKSAGILLEGEGIQVQFKPDRPWRSPKTDNERKAPKKAPKYRSPLGEYDVMLPKSPTEPDYWSNIEKLKERCWQMDGHPCLGLTEGFFSAIAPCANDIPTIALLGVEMGLTPAKDDLQGKRYLVPTLEKYAKLGLGFIIYFDADCATNKNVLWAMLKLAKQLQKYSVPVYIGTGLWKVEEGKGVDDYIQMNGADEFKQKVLAEAKTIEVWEKQFGSSDDYQVQSKPPTPRQLAQELAEKHQPHWVYHNEQKTWRVWNGKCWEAIEDEEFGQMVYMEIKARNIAFDTDSYVENTIKLLRRELLTKRWLTFDRTRYIAFENGVLDMETGKLLEHSPGMRFTSFIPRRYSILENFLNLHPLGALQQLCPHTHSYMMKAMGGDRQQVMKLLAICNAVLKWRLSEFQMFIHLIGEPGAGKGTFIRLLQGLVGKPNHRSATLGKLSDDYTIANIIDSQLVICPDEDKKNGNHGGLKALTGGDDISYREIYKKPASSPFYGGLLVVSNTAIFAGDTTGLERRLSLVNFKHRLAAHERNPKIEVLIEQELAALTAVALMLPDICVEEMIKGIGAGEIPEFRAQAWKLTVDTNSVGLHIEEELVYAPGAYTEVSKLYDRYTDLCESFGRSPMEKNRYSQELARIASQIGWELSHDRITIDGKKHRVIRNVRPRSLEGLDDDIPMPSELLAAGTAGTARDSTGTVVKSVLSLNEDKDSSLRGQHLDEKLLFENFSSSESEEKTPKINIEAKTEDVAVPLEPQGFDTVPSADTVPSPAVPCRPQKLKKAKFKPCLGMQPRPHTINRKGRKVHLPAAYPGTNGHNQTKEPEAIAGQLKAIQSQSDYQAIEKLHGERRTLWVFCWCLTLAEQDAVRLVASGKQNQGKLFD